MLVPSPIACPSNWQFVKRSSKTEPSSLKPFPPPRVRCTLTFLNRIHWLDDRKSLFRALKCIPTPANPSTLMSSKVEYHKPEFTGVLASKKNPSSLVFPTEPKRRKPESSTF